MPSYHVESLRAEAAPSVALAGLDAGGRARGVRREALAEVFLAAWRTVALVALEPGAALGPRDLDGSEAMVYVTGGAGTAHLGHGPVALREGIALTLFAGERLHLQAADAGLELFLAEVGTERPTG